MREFDPPLRDDDFDERFAEIVRGFHVAGEGSGAIDPTDRGEPATGVEPAESETADTQPVAEAPPRRVNPPPRPAPMPPSPADPPAALDVPVWRGATGAPIDEVVAAEADEHFVPPPPRPLPPQEDLHFWGIVVGLVGGPLLLLWLVIFRPNVGEWWTWLAFGLCITGFVLLVMRSPRDHDDQDPGNGAVV